MPAGQTPHTVVLYGHNDLVDYVSPGDRVAVTGIYRATPLRVNPRQRNVKAVYKTYIDCDPVLQGWCEQAPWKCWWWVSNTWFMKNIDIKVDRAGQELDGRLRCMWTLPSCARCVIRARSLLAPESWWEYPARTSLVSLLHMGVVSRHARGTLRNRPVLLIDVVKFMNVSSPWDQIINYIFNVFPTKNFQVAFISCWYVGANLEQAFDLVKNILYLKGMHKIWIC